MRKIIVFGLLFSNILISPSFANNGKITGILNKWQPVTITFKGPKLTEESSTFRDYRLNVTFTNGKKSYIVPGYFAADGNAANTSASSGNKWRVVFTPDMIGEWNYSVSFKRGTNIAANNDDIGKPIAFDGEKGSFVIKDLDVNTSGVYSKGKLLYVGEHYLQFAETGEWFVKSGAGGPENFLGYVDFDSTYNVAGGLDDKALGANGLHEYNSHIGDWQVGNPTWKKGKGKAIIGAVNYLASKGLNSLYFVVNNVNGDGRDCWPWATYEARDVYDVSKLAQWDIVFQHMNAKGIELDFIFWESENTQLLNGGDLGIERRIYYRELIARFGHLPAIRWNISEEPTITPEQVLADAKYINSIDPYGHAIGAECGYTPERREAEYPPLLGHKYFTGAWMQCHENLHQEVLKYSKMADATGHKWVVGVDESTPNYPENVDKVRNEFWEVVTAGGEGFLVYFGYRAGTTDVDNEDFRNRDAMWTQLAFGIDLFKKEKINKNLPKMVNHNELGNGRIFALPGETYIIYVKEEVAKLDLTGIEGTFKISWLEPKSGNWQNGSLESVQGGEILELGNPPSKEKEWVLWVQKQ